MRYKDHFKHTKKGKPLISIITVVYNGDKFIEETIKSVLAQKYDNIEYIIIDGGSSDATLKIIQKYEDNIDHWVSESDSGMYDALNKGLELVKGEIINFCNADDLFYSNDVLQLVADEYNSTGFDCCYGKGAFIDKKSKIISYHFVLDYKERYLLTLGSFFMQPSFFWTRDIMSGIGVFDLNYTIVSDRDFISRVCLASNKVIRIDQFLVKFRQVGDSFGDKNRQLAQRQTNKITKKLRKELNVSFIYFYTTIAVDRIYQKCYRILKRMTTSSHKGEKSYKL